MENCVDNGKRLSGSKIVFQKRDRSLFQLAYLNLDANAEGGLGGCNDGSCLDVKVIQTMAK